MKYLRMFHFQWIIALFLPLCLAQTCRPINTSRGKDPDLYGVYISTLDGKNMKPVITDSFREMNHARVSPDKKWVTFSRFNVVKNGVAEERNGYNKTEVMIVRLDGTELRNLTPPRFGIFTLNSYWTPDGKAILYMSNDNPRKQAKICQMDIATEKSIPIQTPEELHVADPHQVGSKIVFPAVTNPNADIRTTWIKDMETKVCKQLTNPLFPDSAKTLKPHPGDSDPKLSPDGSMVALSRHMSQDVYHTVIVDLKTGKERVISEGPVCDVMPEWSSDSKLLIFWHADRKNVRNSGLYTIRPDGTERKKVPLPSGYFYIMPAFFPDEGSSQQTRIIFSAKKVPGL